MSRAATTVIALATLASGIAIGYYIALWHQGNLWIHISAGRNAAQLSLDTKLMRKLRSGEHAAVLRTLEPLTYSDAATLGLVLKEIPPTEWDSSYARALQDVATYRAEFPSQDEPPELRAAVESALELAKGEIGVSSNKSLERSRDR